jgi:hypothetical protein
VTASYRPRSTLEAADFYAAFCSRCLKDAPFRDGSGDSCPIAAQGFGVALGLEPPPEWVRGDNGPACAAFEAEAA